LAQTLVFLLTDSVALLADLIHNFGDALTAVPIGIACVAGFVATSRLINPSAPDHLLALAAAGLIGFGGNLIAAVIRTRAGRRLNSAALIADGNHARVDALVSLGVVGSAVFVALGADVADPLISLAITAVILRITWDSWRTVRAERWDHEHATS
jgi:divalent metal cation (Fe/Co/Zn/Cd) transporter